MPQGKSDRWLPGADHPPSPGRRVVLIASSLAIVLALIGGGLAWRSYQDRVAREQALVAEAAVEAARATNQFFAARLAVLRSVARVPAFETGDVDGMAPVLEALSSTELGFQGGVGWIDAAGVLRLDGGGNSLVSVDLSDRTYVREVFSTRAPVVSEAVEGRLSGEVVIVLAVPTFSTDGELGGILVVSLPVADLTMNVPALAGFSGTLARVVDRAGMVILEGGRVGPLTSPPNPAVVTAVGDPSVGDGLMGEPRRIIGVAHAGIPGWVIVNEQSVAIRLAGSRNRLLGEFVVLVALTGFGISGAVVAARRLDQSHHEMVLRTRELEILENLSETLSAAPQISDVADDALAIFSEVFGTEAVMIGLVEKATSSMKVYVLSDGSGVDTEGALPLGESSILADAFSAGETLIMDLDEYVRQYQHVPVPLQVLGGGCVMATRFVGRNASGAVAVFLDGEIVPVARDIELFDAMVPLLGDAFGRAAAAESERMASRAFQHALLPRDTIGGTADLQRALRYLPAIGDVEVGGDWYDLWEIDKARVGVVVGDVVGRGVHAAAVMGQLRSALRAIAAVTTAPDDALANLDALTDQIVGSPSATVLLGNFDLESCIMTLASAGHLPPVLVSEDGVKVLYEVRGAPIGFLNQPTKRVSHQHELSPEDTMIFYTDGLVERRGETIDQGIARLVGSVKANRDLSIEALADAILEACMEPDNQDDVALVCIRPVREFPRHFTRVLGTDEFSGMVGEVHSWMNHHGDPPESVELATAQLKKAGNVLASETEEPPGEVLIEILRKDRELVVTLGYRSLAFGSAPTIVERRIARGWETSTLARNGPLLRFVVPLEWSDSPY